MDKLKKIQTLCVQADGSESVEERDVLSEHLLSLCLDGKLFRTILCTNTNLKELCIGRLYVEDLLKDPEEIRSMEFSEDDRRVDIRFFAKENSRQENSPGEKDKNCVTESASGRICAAPNSEAVDAAAAEVDRFLAKAGAEDCSRRVFGQPAGGKLPWKREWIFAFARELRPGAELYRRSQGTHCCILQRNGEILFRCEDISRHNVVDKAIGFALLNGIPFQECILFNSGRIPSDVIVKLSKAGIPVLVSKSNPTLEAVQMAKENGITLICRAWEDSFEIVC